MAARSAAYENYAIACEMNECRWEYKQVGTANWEPFPDRDHKIIETAHVLKERFAHIIIGGHYASRVKVDLQQRRFIRSGYGSEYNVRRMVLYSPEDIEKRRDRKRLLQFARNGPAKAFADSLFDQFKNEPDSDEEEDVEAADEVIDENIMEFCAEIGIDATSIQPAILFWQMNVKGYVAFVR